MLLLCWGHVYDIRAGLEKDKNIIHRTTQLINSTYGTDASVPVIVQYVAHYIVCTLAATCKYLISRVRSSNKLSCSSLSKSQQKEFGRH